MFKDLKYSKQDFTEYFSSKYNGKNYFDLLKTNVIIFHAKAREYFGKGFTISTNGKFLYSDKILTFSSTGFENNSIQIPLIVSKSSFIKNKKQKKYLASFIGNAKTHRGIRGALKYIENDNIFVSFDSFDESEYYNVLCNSKFALCPRGIALNSYRVCEALMCGCVPVYISDQFVDLPELDNYCIKVNSCDIDKIEQILNSVSDEKISEYLSEGKKAFKKYYTYEGLSTWIIDKINELS